MTATPPNTSLADSRRTTSLLPANIGRGLTGLFDRQNAKPFLWSAAAIGVSYLIEDDVREEIMKDDDELSEFASDYLGPLGLGIITAGIFAAGRSSDNPVFRNMSFVPSLSPSFQGVVIRGKF